MGTLTDYSERFRKSLRKVGLTDLAIDAAWPAWWTKEAEDSPSARSDLRFSIARKLGLDPRSLLEDQDEPRFVWRDEAKFKNLSAETELQKAAITSFGMSTARMLIDATSTGQQIVGVSAGELRAAILANQVYVRLVDLLALGWAVGIPIVYLRVFPLNAKRTFAMAVRVKDRHAILLGKDSAYPAQVAFYLAHELGHIALGHLEKDPVLVDLDLEVGHSSEDKQEEKANRFALELLTGRPDPTVLSTARRPGAAQLARKAIASSRELRIEPGTIALCYGFSEKNWPTAVAALKRLYSPPKEVWRDVNSLAMKELGLQNIAEDSSSFLKAVLAGK